MKKQFKLLILLMFAGIGLFAQTIPRQVISTAGGQVTSGSVLLSFTVGQAGPVDAVAPAAFYITQGFQQGDELWVSIRNNPVIYNAVSVYPNPSNGIFNLKGTLPEAGGFDYSVFDMNGSLKLSGSSSTVNSGEIDESIDLCQFASGYYTLLIHGGIDEGRYTCVTKLSLVK